MRKIFVFLSALLLTSSTATLVIACQPTSLGDLWVITDGGDLFDQAFNQQILEGAQDFVGKFNQNKKDRQKIEQLGVLQTRNAKLRWIISANSNLSTLQNNYNIAVYAGAKTIILAGFNHVQALSSKVQSVFNNYGVKFILVDANLSQAINVASITYASEQSAFLSGIAAALWLLANHEKYSDHLKVSTFGAVPAPTIINYMAGYYWGVYYINQYKNFNKNILPLVNKLRASDQKMPQSELNNLNIDFVKLGDSFSNNFDAGGAVNITKILVDNNNINVILPVAGAQTTDLIKTIRDSNKNAKIVGVDTDQAKRYGEAEDLFLTSALKGIRTSVEWMLWNSLNLRYENSHIIYDQSGSDYFNCKKVNEPLSDARYIGIADNDPISSIYQDITNSNSIFRVFANKVSTAMKKLADDINKRTTKDPWREAWNQDITENSKFKPDFDL